MPIILPAVFANKGIRKLDVQRDKSDKRDKRLRHSIGIGEWCGGSLDCSAAELRRILAESKLHWGRRAKWHSAVPTGVAIITILPN